MYIDAGKLSALDYQTSGSDRSDLSSRPESPIGHYRSSGGGMILGYSPDRRSLRSLYSSIRIRAVAINPPAPQPGRTAVRQNNPRVRSTQLGRIPTNGFAVLRIIVMK